jgi:hypothetical protein
LFRLNIVRCRAERGLRGNLLSGCRIEDGHGPGQRNRVLWPFCGAWP